MDENAGITKGCVLNLIDRFSLDSGPIFADDVDPGRDTSAAINSAFRTRLRESRERCSV
jgi:hypothetical protein